MSGDMRMVKWVRLYYSKKPIKLPTPDTKMYQRDGKKTIFHNLQDAITEGKKWETEDTPFPIITLEQNGYYRFYGHGAKVH